MPTKNADCPGESSVNVPADGIFSSTFVRIVCVNSADRGIRGGVGSISNLAFM